MTFATDLDTSNEALHARIRDQLAALREGRPLLPTRAESEIQGLSSDELFARYDELTAWFASFRGDDSKGQPAEAY